MRRFAAFIKQHRSFTVFCILALLVLLVMRRKTADEEGPQDEGA